MYFALVWLSDTAGKETEEKAEAIEGRGCGHIILYANLLLHCAGEVVRKKKEA